MLAKPCSICSLGRVLSLSSRISVVRHFHVFLFLCRSDVSRCPCSLVCLYGLTRDASPQSSLPPQLQPLSSALGRVLPLLARRTQGQGTPEVIPKNPSASPRWSLCDTADTSIFQALPDIPSWDGLQLARSSWFLRGRTGATYHLPAAWPYTSYSNLTRGICSSALLCLTSCSMPYVSLPVLCRSAVSRCISSLFRPSGVSRS